MENRTRNSVVIGVKFGAGRAIPRPLRAALLLLVASLVLSGPAGGVLDLSWFTIDGGGAMGTTGGTLVLGGTVGQPDAGALVGGTYELYGGFWSLGEAQSGIWDPPGSESALPVVFRVTAGAPNPFVHATGIYLDLPEPRPVQIQVLDPGGRSIRRICDFTLPAGHHRFSWDGRTDGGQAAASGAYMIKVRAGNDETHRSVILMR
jgi:hypothetical protein